MSFSRFLKSFDEEVYREYRMDEYKNPNQSTLNNPKKSQNILQDLENLFSPLELVSKSAQALEYLRDRKIPSRFLKQLYWTEDFNQFVRTNAPERIKSDSVKAGIVIPLLDTVGMPFGYQCRYFIGRLRYKSIILDESKPKAFGLQGLDFSKKIHMTEGVFDSMFLPNSLAALDSGLSGRAAELVEMFKIPADQFILWYDAEPNNSQIMKQKKKAIDAGFTVAFYPAEFLRYAKDINDLVKTTGIKKSQEILSKVEFLSGLRAVARHKLNK